MRTLDFCSSFILVPVIVMIIVIMGACGCGKTTIAKLLAEKMKVPFIEGDDFHPVSNRQKMSKGVPLNDEDRTPWLLQLYEKLKSHNNTVLACSALKESYRNILVHGTTKPYESCDTIFVLLRAEASLLEGRLLRRKGHFMPPSLIQSQLETLQPFAAHERYLIVDAALACELIVAKIWEHCDVVGSTGV